MPINFDLDGNSDYRRPEWRESQVVPPPPARVDMTVERGRAYLAQYEAGIEDAKAKIDAILVDDDEKCAAVIDTVAVASRILKGLETARKAIVKEPKTFCDLMKKAENVYADRLKNIIATGRTKSAAYMREKALREAEAARKREEEARRIREEEERRQEAIRQEIIADEKRRAAEMARAEAIAAGESKADAEAAAKAAAAITNPAIEMPPLPEIATPTTPTTVARGNIGSAHLTGRWKLKGIVDFSIVPDEYKTIDTKKVNAAIRAGVRSIPGLEIINEKDITIR